MLLVQLLTQLVSNEKSISNRQIYLRWKGNERKGEGDIFNWNERRRDSLVFNSYDYWNGCFGRKIFVSIFKPLT